LIKNGSLDELREEQKKVQLDKFLSMKPYGGYTMLIYAATEGHLDIINYLIKLGADVNETSDVSPLVLPLQL